MIRGCRLCVNGEANEVIHGWIYIAQQRIYIIHHICEEHLVLSALRTFLNLNRSNFEDVRVREYIKLHG